jgi:hypothetical protein
MKGKLVVEEPINLVDDTYNLRNHERIDSERSRGENNQSAYKSKSNMFLRREDEYSFQKRTKP